MDKNIYMLITEKQLLVNAKRVDHGLLLERDRPLAQDLLLLLSLVLLTELINIDNYI